MVLTGALALAPSHAGVADRVKLPNQTVKERMGYVRRARVWEPTDVAAKNLYDGPDGPLGRIATLIWDARFSLVTALLAGFGRAAAEVGAVIIVGGNIDGFTRTMTTAIALETSKGDLPLAIGLGIVLIAIVIVVNALAWGARRAGERFAG